MIVLARKENKTRRWMVIRKDANEDRGLNDEDNEPGIKERKD